MADKTKIEWTDSTWNPITGCTLVSEGCRHCYAARLAATRLKDHPSRAGLARLNAAGEAKFTGEVRFNREWLDQPLRWKKPRRIFVCAHGDLFHESVPDDWINCVFGVMAIARHHTFQVLTKRPERARQWFQKPRQRSAKMECVATLYVDNPELARPFPFDVKRAIVVGLTGWPLPNVWLGTSVEDQTTANERIPHLLATPAAVRFVSAEPLLGPVDLTSIEGDPSWQPSIKNALTGERRARQGNGSVGSGFGPRLDWVIVGGESGPNARPMHPDWARSLRDQCKAAGVAFFMKQLSGPGGKAIKDMDGFPSDLRVRGWPDAA